METAILRNKEIYNEKFRDRSKNDLIYEPVIELIIDIIKRNGYNRILDYGCGDGRFGFYFKTSFKDIELIGIDIAEESLKICMDIYDRVYITDGYTILNLQCDFVIISNVLEHIPVEGWDIFLENIKKAIKPGGGCL